MGEELFQKFLPHYPMLKTFPFTIPQLINRDEIITFRA